MYSILYHRKWYIAKTRCFGLHFCHSKFGYIFNHLYVNAPRKLPGSVKKSKIWAISPFRVIQGHRFWYQLKAHIRLPIIVIKTNLITSYLAPFRKHSIPNVKNRYIWQPLLRLNPRTEVFPWDDLRTVFSECQRLAKVPNGIEILPKISTRWVGRTNVTDWQTDDRQTDGR